MGKKIVVLGCGVVGLTSALQLKRSDPSYDITVIGQHLPGDYDLEYTSPHAGANWHSFASHEDTQLQQFDTPGYHEFRRLGKEVPRSGVWQVPNVIYHNQAALDEVNGDTEKLIPWFKDLANVRVLDRARLPPDIVFAFEYDGVVISTQLYLHYLLQELADLGVTVKRVSKLKSVQEALYYHSSGEKADFVINATGLLAKSLQGVEDAKRTYQVRGQVLHVRNNCKVKLSVKSFPEYPYEALYMMPRKEGGTIIGGTFYDQFTNTEEDKSLTQRIIARATKYAPELLDPSYKNNSTEIDIIRVGVGLRPFRESGVRVEQDPRHDWLIHNYGAGGGGYQGSYGFANKVVELVAKKLKLKLNL